MERQGSRGVMLVGMAVSLALHAALAAAVVRNASLAEEAMRSGSDSARNDVVLEPEPERIRLGIERGDPAATAWLGFEDETEHHALPGVEDQSAMVLEEGSGEGVAGAALAEPAMAPEDAVKALAELSQAAQPEAMPQREQGVADGQVGSDGLLDWEALTGVAERLGDVLGSALAAARAEETKSHEQPADDAGDVTDAVVMEHQPATEVLSSPGSGGGERGIVSDRESSAASIREAPATRMVDGRVRAAEGLEVLTRRPRWTFSTSIMRRPRNPTLEIVFGTDGRVMLARFATDGTQVYNTGYDDVDQPLLNAVYGWRAQGKAIDELPPDGELRLLMTVILR